MPTTIKVLGQLRPADVNPAVLYQPAVNVEGVIRNITVCNVTDNDVFFRIFIDADGTAQTEDEALFWDVILEAASTLDIEINTGLNELGSLSVRSDTPDGINFTAHGAEIT